ncbi:MAG: hypothetical protein JXR30_01350 [Alphaproteobacteria bacterium]|nr:hypothetical protein [Alphaproteobacteria bacterium]
MITQEIEFDVLIRKNNQVVFLLKARPMPPINALLAFNPKNQQMLLTRDEHEDIALLGLSKNAIHALKTEKKALILELDENGNIQYQYTIEIFLDTEMTIEKEN